MEITGTCKAGVNYFPVVRISFTDDQILLFCDPTKCGFRCLDTCPCTGGTEQPAMTIEIPKKET